MDPVRYQTDVGWSSSPVSDLSGCMQGLRCRDRPDLTPEQKNPDGGKASVSGGWKKKMSPDRSFKARGLGGAAEDEDTEDEKENDDTPKRVRVRLFNSPSPEEQESGSRPKRPYYTPPTEGDMEAPDPVSVMLLQKLRSSGKSSHTSIPDTAISEQHLIGDYSKHHVLPVEDVEHRELHCVSAQTVASLIRGEFSSVVGGFLIVDCRYPYEYEGGHIRGAVNLYTESQIRQAFLQTSSPSQASPGAPGGRMQASGSPGGRGAHDGASSTRKLVVFHCEFSSARGPKLCKYLRELDRCLNAQAYPHLLYPELYLLQGGYKNFYSCCPELCEPQGYVSMRHRAYRQQLRLFSRKRNSHRSRCPIRSQQTTESIIKPCAGQRTPCAGRTYPQL